MKRIRFLTGTNRERRPQAVSCRMYRGIGTALEQSAKGTSVSRIVSLR